MTTDGDKAFNRDIAVLYERDLVPLIFAPYAQDLAARLASRPVTSVLEIAAGTGVVTRQLAAMLPSSTAILATDLNQPMLDIAQAIGTTRPVEWRQADAMQLPFADTRFDAVVCQFGVMFFPDKAKAFAEIHRVLAPGGILLFNVWDRIEANEFTHAAAQALETMFPVDPPRFMARVPHGYFDLDTIRRDLLEGGFTRQAVIDTVALRSRAESARIAAVAICQGTPLRNEIEARDPSRLEKPPMPRRQRSKNGLETARSTAASRRM
jgi:SAM-dependent methyltransferase